jgi:DNA-directed RNA polymerase specialized sigma24 family protein
MQDCNRAHTAKARLVRLHHDWVYSEALRHAGDPHLAEDVVPSVFVRLARNASDLASGCIRCIFLISRRSN